MTGHTTINGREVPLHGGDLVTIVFSGGPGEGDAGPKDFWTAESPSKNRKLTVRWRHGEDPGERYRMMKGAKGYEEHWEIARTATAIRPATQAEVLSWLNQHPQDAPFAQTCQTTRITRVVRTNDGFRFE
jgi:hypothetical protein